MAIQPKYIGEHLLPGQIGQIAITLTFVGAITALIAYFFATQRRDSDEYKSWRTFGRLAFTIHGLSVFTVIGTLFYVMINQFYEYEYVQAHVSADLPFRYIFSAFWEDQEGSFLLWMFWHSVLGFVLMGTAKKWEAPTLAVLALVQILIASMIQGIYLTDELKIGSNPLLLLRDVYEDPLFANPEYVNQIKGEGLNPLLQNYWNTIHPPTLFLGFASTVVPFCFAIAGVWTGQFKEWLRPAQKWGLFSAGILGTGILMGGAWAYEALNFGGYWAWDPVENASLVPWLLLVAGLHTNLIANATGHSIRTTYIFYVLTFFFILYSTFLTRSGVLGETSVHAFTEMGLENQLVSLMAIPLLLGLVLLFTKGRAIPSPKQEESASSKEFWIFIGSLVLLFSSVLIIGATSLPIYNKIRQLFDPIYEGIVIEDPVAHYNRYQLWIAVFMGVLSGVTQYLRYKERNFSKYFRKFAIHTSVAMLLTVGLTWLTLQWINAQAWQYVLLLGAGIFTIVCNVDYIFNFTRRNLKMAGSAISHIGFGLMIVGILASSMNKTYLSTNRFAMEGLIKDADLLNRNVLLWKNDMLPIKGYEVTYVNDTLDRFTRTFQINFKQRDKDNNIVEEFDVYPNVLYTKDFSKVAAPNPDTKHYLGKDVFTHIANLPAVELDTTAAREFEESLKFNEYEVPPNQAFAIQDTFNLTVRGRDTTVIRSYKAAVTEITRTPTHHEYTPDPKDMLIGARVEILAEDSIYVAEPMLALRGQYLYSFPSQINDITTKVKLGEEMIDLMMPDGEPIAYEEYTLKKGEKALFNGCEIEFVGFNKSPNHPDYRASNQDIALVGAVVKVSTPDNKQYSAEPIYWIRGNRAMNLKAQIFEEGLHVRFNSIDPKTETVSLSFSKYENGNHIPLEIATNSSRTDFIVLEAIEFQGINFFWLGTILMLIGLFFSMTVRIRQRQMAAPVV